MGGRLGRFGQYVRRPGTFGSNRPCLVDWFGDWLIGSLIDWLSTVELIDWPLGCFDTASTCDGLHLLFNHRLCRS